jgi:hypothetical protein
MLKEVENVVPLPPETIERIEKYERHRVYFLCAFVF